MALLRKALTAGLLMNAVQLVDTANDISDPASAGINVYRILRSTGPGRCPLRLCLSLCLLMKPRVACSYMHACFRVGRRSHACLACLVHHGFVSGKDYLHKHLRKLSL